ncbi:Neuferricin, partial [Eufriesea mexicana]
VDKWLNIIKNFYLDLNKKSNLELNVGINQKVFTTTELKKYTNLKDGLYISILGHVFDVTKGAKHYGPGATYHAFTGRDASLAYITGKFNDEGLTDDISSLSIEEVKGLNEWLKFYNKNYIYKGKLNGRYYNKDGFPTEESHNVQNMINQFEKGLRKIFPPCNIEWKADSGTVVWCTKKSGGIERDWIGVPRMLFESYSPEKYTCVCVELDSKEYKENKYMLREYAQCPKTSIKCAVKTEN